MDFILKHFFGEILISETENPNILFTLTRATINFYLAIELNKNFPIYRVIGISGTGMNYSMFFLTFGLLVNNIKKL